MVSIMIISINHLCYNKFSKVIFYTDKIGGVMYMFLRHKAIRIVFIGLILIGLLIGCSPGGEENTDTVKSENNSENPPSINTEELVYANFRDIRDLNPHIYSGELFAQNLLFEGLVKITEDGVIPWLAKDWDISEDGKAYTFYLRQDVSFTDGYKFDAQAVKANFDAIYDNKDRHTWLELIRLLEGFEVVDDYTFRIKLTKPYYPLLTEMALTRPFRFISPNCMIDGTTKDGVDGLIGTGAYVLTENHIDEYAIFDVNENYWGEKPSIKRIIAKVIPDNQIRTLALEKGEIDILYGTNMIDADTYSKFDKMDGFEVTISDPVSTRMLIFNTTDEVLGDLAVRQAISHAVNKAEISEGIFQGLESPADTIFSKKIPYCNVDLEPYEYSVEKAQETLDNSGWILNDNTKIREKNGLALEVDMYYNSNNVTEKTISEYLQSELMKIGVKINILGEEEQSYEDRMKNGDFDITFNISWGTPYDPQSFLGAMRMPVYGDYEAQQGLDEKQKIDDSILKALTVTDERERQELYDYILTTLHEEAVYLPLTYQRNRAVFSDKVKNVTFNPSQFEIPFEKMYIK